MKIIQISDSHIHQDPTTRLFGLVNTEDTFLDVLKLVKKENPDFVLATGDLSQDGSMESYQRLNNHLNGLNCMVYAIYGNHDNPANFDRWLIGNNVRCCPILETDKANFIFLSSYKAGFDSGYIDDYNLQHLKASLELYDNCIPVIHHHFIPLGTAVDNYILENNLELLELLKSYKSRVKFCITGHVHNSYQSESIGVTSYSSLSTCIQFAKTNEVLFDNKSPGFTIYNLCGDSYEIIEKTI